MYQVVLIIHSWLRWGALLFGGAATLNAIRHRDDTAVVPRSLRWGWWLMLALDLQVLFGLLLYLGLSPFTREALSNPAMALRDPNLRFWAITHMALMCFAVVAVRTGRVLENGEKGSFARRNGPFICFGIAVLAMVAGVPWPGLAVGRPLLRF